MQRAASLEKTDARKDWRQKEKGATESEVVRQHHCINGHEFEQTLEDSAGQGTVVCCSPRVGHDLMTEQRQLQLPSIQGSHLAH